MQGDLDFPNFLRFFIQGHLQLIVNIFHFTAATNEINDDTYMPWLYDIIVLTIQKFCPKKDWLFCRLFELFSSHYPTPRLHRCPPLGGSRHGPLESHDNHMIHMRMGGGGYLPTSNSKVSDIFSLTATKFETFQQILCLSNKRKTWIPITILTTISSGCKDD